MKYFVVFAVLIVAALAAPLDESNVATILKYENDNIGIDGYNFAFETSDGISRQETAELKDIGTEEKALSVRGSVTWTGPDGQTYTLNYVADENGYQPEGDFLPKA